MAPWRRSLARHYPGKILRDLAVSLSVTADCLSNVAQQRGAPEVFDPVASNPMVPRFTTPTPPMPPPRTPRLSGRGRRHGRGRGCWPARTPRSLHERSRPLEIHMDTTQVTAHSERE